MAENTDIEQNVDHLNIEIIPADNILTDDETQKLEEKAPKGLKIIQKPVECAAIQILGDTNLYCAQLAGLPFYYGREVLFISEFGMQSGHINSIQFNYTIPKEDSPRNKGDQFYYCGEIIRYLTPEDFEHKKYLDAQAIEKRAGLRDLAIKHNLAMNITQVHLSFDEKAMAVFYTAPERVDFREFLKDARAAYKMKLTLRQIGDHQRFNSFKMDPRDGVSNLN